MIYRWLHKSWKYFWRTVFVLLLIATLLSGIIVGLLQLDVTQNYLTNRIEQQVEDTYRADLSIGDIDGFLPFWISLYDVTLMRETATEKDTLISIREIESEIDIWGLLQNRLTITGFSMQQPEVYLQSNDEGKLVLLERRSDIEQKRKVNRERWLNKIEIIAPEVQIKNGHIALEATTQKHKIGDLPQSFSLQNVNTTLFVDWSESQRYLDIESFTADPENLEIENVSASGQLYNDQRFLEFNSFYLTLGNSRFVLNGEVDGVNILELNITQQLIDAQYDLAINSEQMFLSDLRDLIPRLSDNDQPMSFDFRTEGSADSLWIDRAELGLGNSYINLNGLAKNLVNGADLSYQFDFDGANLQNRDLVPLLDMLSLPNNRALQNISIAGDATGDLKRMSTDFTLNSTLGSLALEGEAEFVAPFRYQGMIRADSLDISPFLANRVDTTALNFDAQFKGKELSLEKAVSDVNITFTDSRVGNHLFDQLEFITSLDKGVLNQEYIYRNQEENSSGSSRVDFTGQDPIVTLKGKAENFNLAHFSPPNSIAETALNFDYNIELQGLSAERIQGRANLDVGQSMIAGDTVRAHQLYMDLNSPDASTREFRLTSSLLDLNITGEVTPEDVISQARFWGSYLKDRFKSEVLMTDQPQPLSAADSLSQKNVVVEGNMQVKDLDLIKTYFPESPSLYAKSELAFNINTDGKRLLFSADMNADSLAYNSYNFSESSTQFTASFRSDRSLRDFSSIDWEANIAKVETPSVDLSAMNFDLSVKQDSVHFTQKIGAISDDAQFELALRSSLSDSVIAVSIERFFLGNENYAWMNEFTPQLRYLRTGEVDFDDFSFQNQNEYFRLQGKLTPERTDSLTYTLRDINLQRISDLIKGRIDFDGVLNGTLITKSLTRQPTIQGNLNVNRFRLNERPIGDIRFNSEFNADRSRFDTQIDIKTDSTKYQKYLQTNDDIGQNIRLDGYFVTPDPSVSQDTVYHFDADFNQVDLWFLALIVDNVFAEVEGEATGTGEITGNLEDYDFQTRFEAENVFARPQFLNTNYFLSGPVEFNSDEGVVLDSLNVMDTKGGTGTAWGNVDLNDFEPITYFDLSIDMNQLQFLNSEMDPDVPFYGNVSGSGMVRLSGSNTDVYLRTPDPLEVSSDSEVSIPLLEETELQETGKFIRFVDSFDEIYKKSQTALEENNRASASAEEAVEEALEELTFSERFDLDLRFNASDNVSVNLIFDPVTGEVLTAQGTGQLRISMQDQDVQMFGQYNITDGNYQFVTGEIISRDLQLESGGTIIWEGPPDNARLNISAVYNARPNVSTLLSGDNINTQNQNGNQQVPIDLIVEITGTLNSVENNYYFRLPSTLDLSSNSTLQYTLNQINRDEQQKLLQATSVLFTGQFIPTQGIGSGTATLSQNLARGSTYINPLLSSQVSSLLSNQINTLLNSDVSRLDIDFNLNAYNEVDLGIALRLYNDRLILRREGQITGGMQSTPGDRLGDLNATYRIRKGLSLTAFHRQDQALNSIQSAGPQAGDVTPYVDGLGLESNVQFNTWGELMDRIRRVFSGIFGRKNNSENNE